MGSRYDNISRIISNPNFYDLVELKVIPGWRHFPIAGEKGGVETLSTTAWDDLTNIPSTQVIKSPNGENLELVSSSSSDDIAGELGVKKVDIHYLENGVEKEKRVDITGDTPVDLSSVITATDIQWTHSALLGTSAPNGSAAGIIDLQTLGGGTIYSRIDAGSNQSLSSQYRVPLNHIGLAMNANLSGVKQELSVKLRATRERFNRKLIPGVFTFTRSISLNDSTLPGGSFPIFLPSLCQVKASGISKAAGGKASVNYDIIVIHKDAL